MISLPNPSAESVKLTSQQRAHIIELISSRYLDGMSCKDLERFFYDIQLEYMLSYSDEELLSELEDVTNEEEFDEAINYAS